MCAEPRPAAAPKLPLGPAVGDDAESVRWRLRNRVSGPGQRIISYDTALALRLFMFERHTSDNQDARHVSHLAHGGLLLLNAAAYAWLR